MTCCDACLLVEQGELAHNPSPARPYDDQDAVDEARALVIDAANRLYGVDGKRDIMIERVPVVYNTRLRATAARAKLVVTAGVVTPIQVEVASKITLPADYVIPVLVHEFCHVARGLESDDYLEEKAHGYHWKALMRAAGQKPDPYITSPDVIKQAAALRTKRTATPAWVVREQRSAFRLGDRVFFESKGHTVSGTIRKRNPKTANVRLEDGTVYRVSYALLRR